MTGRVGKKGAGISSAGSAVRSARKPQPATSQAELEAAFNSITQLVMLLGNDHKIKWANEAAAAFFNLPMDKIVGEYCFTLMHGKDKPVHNCPLVKMTKSHEHEEAEIYIADKKMWAQVKADPQFDKKGSVTSIVHTVENISERKRAEEALRHSETFLQSIIEHSPYAMFISDSNGTMTKMNKALRDLFHVTDEELVGKYNVFQDNIVEQQGYMPLVRNVFEKGEIVKFTLKYDSSQLKSLQLQRKASVILEITVSPVIGADGKITNAIFQHVNITERKLAEEALKASEAQYRLLSEHTIDTVGLMDKDLNIIYISPSSEKLRGFTAQEIMQMSFDQQLTPESFKLAMEVILRELPRVEAEPDYNPVMTLELEYTCKNGTTVWMENKFSVIRDENGKLEGILAESRDITERRQAMEALRESEELYRSLFENLLNGFAYCKMIFEHDKPRDFIYLAVNTAFEKQTGLKGVTGKKVSEVIPGIYEADPRLFEIYGRVALTGIPEEFETYVSALKMWFSVSVYSPKKEYFVAVFDVITERKLNEEKLLKSYASLKKNLNDAINTMVKIVELRDPYTAGHQQNVSALATAIAVEMKLEDARIDQLRMAAVIHDIGKMYIPSDILSKPGNLTYIEFNLIKTHPQYGYDIIIGMDFPSVVAQAVLQHHERLDGSGYPGGLKGEDTLLEAKILAVADVVEAMASHRPYRSALGIGTALEEITKNKGKLYDPYVVDACLELFNSGRFAFKTV